MSARSLIAVAAWSSVLLAMPAAQGDALVSARSVRFDLGNLLHTGGTIVAQRTITPEVSVARGRLVEGGRFTLVRVKGRAVTATVQTPGATYVIGEGPNGMPVVQRVDAATLARLCGVGHDERSREATVARAPPGATNDMLTAAGSPSIIRLAVFYPPSALADFEDPESPHDRQAVTRLREHVENAIALMNAMFVASRIDAVVVSAGIEELAFPLSESLVQDVNMMNVSPLVAARRDALRAQVAMLIRSGGEWQGFADVLREPKTPQALAQAREHGAFGAVQTTCIDSGFMCMVHEFAHIVGAAHDRENADGPGFFENSYGFWWDGNDGVCHGDLMSYECIGNREPILSGPELRDHGSATGDARNDNAAGVRAGVKVVAGYR
jgi:hypothetical protein